MTPLKELQSKELAWVKPAAFKHVYELRAGDEVVARLDWAGGLATPAKAKASDGEWVLQRHGFIRPRVTARAGSNDKDAATFEPAWAGGGEVSLAGGGRLRLAPANMWRSEWRLATSEGKSLLVVRPESGLVRTTARVAIESDGAAHPQLSMLVLLTWASLVLMEEDLALYGV